MKYKYRVYGLNIESGIELEHLIRLEEDHINEIDVKVSYGKMSNNEMYINKEDRTSIMSLDRNNVYLSVKNVAIFHIRNGNEIIVDVSNCKNSRRMKSFLIGWAFGVLFTQRSTIAFHGATIIKNNKAFVIAGKSKSGKSTLSSTLLKRGYEFSSDDIGVVEAKDDNFIIHPSYPVQKLEKKAMKNLGYNIEKYEVYEKGKKRERYKVDRHDIFIDKPLPIEAIFQIEVVDDDRDVSIHKVNGSEKLDFILDNLYFSKVEKLLGMRPNYFKKCLDLAKSLSLYKIKRPNNKYTVDEQIELIENVILDI